LKFEDVGHQVLRFEDEILDDRIDHGIAEFNTGDLLLEHLEKNVPEHIANSQRIQE
jgi:hypothetical protein